jgi:F0F1-type ATP synthase assembly protein I
MINNNNQFDLVKKYREKEKKSHPIYILLLLGFKIVIATVLGSLCGLLLDDYFNTKPACIISLSMVGFLSGFIRIFENKN